MIGRIFKLTCFVALVVVVGYLYHYNSQEIVLILGPGKQVETRAAHAILGLFLTGFLVASLFASLLSIRHHFALRALQQQLRREQEQRALVVQGRNYLVLGDAKQAQQQFQKALQKDPNDALARVLLAESIHLQQGPKEALEILEKMRITDTATAESLFAAAKLNRELGNHTAAFDNVALLLGRVPGNPKAIEQAVSAAASLGRFDEAIELQKQLVQMGSGAEYDSAQKQLARLKVRRALHLAGSEPQKLQGILEGIIKEHRDFPEALILLAELEEVAGRRDTATKLRKKLFELTGESIHLETIARCWLAIDRPDTALAQVESALAAAHGKFESIEAQLFLASLQLHLEMLDQARTTLVNLEPALAENPQLAITGAVLKARLMRREQDLATAFASLVEAIDSRIPLPSTEDIKERISNGKELESWAQRLSTEIQAQSAP